MTADSRVNLGDVLGIWAHPDDEAWLSAGLMMQTIEAGNRVTCVTATKGEAGFPAEDPRTPGQRMALREAELARCLSLLGVTEHRWLGYGDGKCAAVPDRAAAVRLAELIEEVRPETVLTFAPDGATGHSDHIAVCRWATQAVAMTGSSAPTLMYATKTLRWTDEFFAGIDPADVMMVEGLVPEVTDESELAVWFGCDQKLLPRKVAAMRAQESQIEQIVATIGVEQFAALVREEFYRLPRSTDPELIDRMRRLGATRDD